MPRPSTTKAPPMYRSRPRRRSRPCAAHARLKPTRVPPMRHPCPTHAPPKAPPTRHLSPTIAPPKSQGGRPRNGPLIDQYPVQPCDVSVRVPVVQPAVGPQAQGGQQRRQPHQGRGDGPQRDVQIGHRGRGDAARKAAALQGVRDMGRKLCKPQTCGGDRTTLGTSPMGHGLSIATWRRRWGGGAGFPPPPPPQAPLTGPAWSSRMARW